MIQGIFEQYGAVISGISGLVVFFVFIAALKSFIKVSLPDRVLVVTGRKRAHAGKAFGYSVERGRAVVIPYFQRVNDLDLRIIPINVKVEGVNSANGITVGADATACVCIDDDDDAMLYTAAERLMGKTYDEKKEQAQQTLIGNFRGALNKATPLQAIGMEETPDDNPADGTDGERAQFRNELFNDINSDLSTFGMKVVSVSFQKIWDTTNYIANLAERALARKREEVEIEEARLKALAEKAESDGNLRMNIAKSQAEEQILAANEKLEVYRQQSEADIKRVKLEADNMILEAHSRGEKDIQELNITLRELENASDILIEEKAKQRAADILSSGATESAKIRENCRNEILRQKVDMMVNAGEAGNTVLFIQQQLPFLFDAVKQYSQEQEIDSLLIMDDKKGFNGAVNRGPGAFDDFLRHFNNALGINIRDFVVQSDASGVQK
jgi:uncharacterized membrane protein YqiK